MIFSVRMPQLSCALIIIQRNMPIRAYGLEQSNFF